VARGDLEGPLGDTTRKPIQSSDVDPRAPVFTCLVEEGIFGEYQGRALVSAYRFRPDQDQFVVVPLSRACTG
jgi:hypothetical protein